MSDGMLSQEEIDALMNNSGNSNNEKQAGKSVISLEEQDTLGEIGNICMGSSATALSTLLNKKVVITTPSVLVTDRQSFADSYTLPFVVVQVKYREGLSGANVLFIKESDACIIADLMMGGDGKPAEFNVNEIMLSAVAEAMNQMVGSSTTSMSSMFKIRIDIEPPVVTLAQMKDEVVAIDSLHDEIICIKFIMEIEGLINSEIIQIIPIEAVQNLMDLAKNTSLSASVYAQPESQASASTVESISQPNTKIQEREPEYVNNQQNQWAASSPSNYGNDHAMSNNKNYDVQQVQFAPLHESVSTNSPNNISLIMDVPLDVTVELGRTRKTIKDVLDLQQGSIIELEKMAGEAVDMLVNGKLIAKGEVVVIDEYYGIRITAIVSPIDRVNKLQ